MDPDKTTEIKPDNLANCTARWVLPAVLAGVMVPVCAYILTRASIAPEATATIHRSGGHS